MNGMDYVVLCVWLIALSVMFSRAIHLAACVSAWFLPIAEWYPIVWIYHI